MSVPTVIIIRETLWQSVVSDVFTFATVAALICLGVWWQSVALQWIGAVMAVMIILGKSTDKRLTIPQARAKLDDLEAAQ